MKNLKLLVVYLTCLGSLVSCGPKGLDVRVCIVDAANSGFQCAKGKVNSFVSFQDGSDLLCASPANTEIALKACKQRKVVDVPLCQLAGLEFKCSDGSEVSFANADNYACLSTQDHRRMLDRCKSGVLSLELSPSALGNLPQGMLKPFEAVNSSL